MTTTQIRVAQIKDINNGAIKLGGDPSNCVQIGADGHVTLLGTAKAWEDVRVEPIVRSASANSPAFEKWFDDGAGSRGVYLYSFDDAVLAGEKEVHFNLQMPHTWAGTAIYVHVHWIPYANETLKRVRWALEYTFAEPGAVFGTTTRLNASGVDTSYVANTHYIMPFSAITPTTSQDGLSSILIGRIWRNSSNAVDTYTNKIGLLYIDAHYEVNGFGSNDEYS